MKKILNILLICSLLGVSQTSVIAKNKKEKVKNSDKIEIVKPEKQKVSFYNRKTRWLSWNLLAVAAVFLPDYFI